jgi:hypothetical protein
MNMNRLNVFRRLDELETQNLHLQVMLKNVRMEGEALRGAVGDLLGMLENMIRPKPKAAPTPKPKVVKSKAALNAVLEKRREYARKYYAKKKAEKLAVTA